MVFLLDLFVEFNFNFMIILVRPLIPQLGLYKMIGALKNFDFYLFYLTKFLVNIIKHSRFKLRRFYFKVFIKDP